MAGWYVRRGENVIGPIEGAKLKELAATGKLLPTDQIAKDAGGPWTEAQRSSLFPKELTKGNAQPPAVIPPVKQLPAVTQQQPTEITPQKSKATAVITTTKVVIGTVGRGLQSVGGAIGRSLSERAKRKHELKLAEIQAKAMAEANRPLALPQQPGAPVPTATTNQPIVFAPQMTTVVKVINKNGDGCGCSGCASILLLIFLGLLLWGIISSNNSSNPSRSPPSSSSR